MAYRRFLNGLTLSFGLWMDRLTTPASKRSAPSEEIAKHGPDIAEYRYSIIAELEREYGRREYPSEVWMNRRLKERGIIWRVRDAVEYWETFDPRDMMADDPVNDDETPPIDMY